jgi:hypothetical protein
MWNIIRRLLFGFVLEELGLGGGDEPAGSEDVGAEAPNQPVAAEAPNEPVIGIYEETVASGVVISDPGAPPGSAPLQ